MKRYFFNRWTWILFVAALLPRIVDLGRFLTTDEPNFMATAGVAVTQAFLQGNFRGTYWHFYPGVTISWADGLGLLGQWLLAKLSGLTDQPFTRYIEADMRQFLVAVRLPYAILTALFVPAVYHLLRRWLNPGQPAPGPHPLALLAALLIAFDPFFLAHSRVAHGDAPVSVFLVLSALSLLIYLRDGGRKRLIFSVVMGSLAALTKAPGQLIALWVIVVMAGDWALGSKKLGRFDWPRGKQRLLAVIGWGGIALAITVLLWPSLWVDPAGTLRQMLAETFGKVNQGHLVFFRGTPTLDPGPWFYPYVILFRLTPLTSVGALLSLGVLGYLAFHRFRVQSSEFRVLTAYLWFFVIFFLFFGVLSPKKQDRYLLPLFPVLDMLAAIGWFGVWQLLTGHLVRGRRLAWAWLVAAALLQLAFSLPHHPYYLAYFNPLLGGLSQAVETTLVGWGEGMEQAAAYLNQKPDAEALYVASTPAQTLLPYFKGQGENFYTNDVAMRADYVVIYRAQQQRLAPSPEIVNYYLRQEPEHVIKIEGVPYAWIYSNRRLIFSALPDRATLTNIGFGPPDAEAIMRLAGYAVEREEAALEVDLFWHALPAIEKDVGSCAEVRVENVETTVCPRIDYTISLRLLDSAGNPVAQHDSWPANGLLPTSQWRVDDYVQDHHPLALPGDLPAGEYRLSLVVYNNEIQTVLAGPVEFAMVAF